MSSTISHKRGRGGKESLTGSCIRQSRVPSVVHTPSTSNPSISYSTTPEERDHTTLLTPSSTNNLWTPNLLSPFNSFTSQNGSPIMPLEAFTPLLTPSPDPEQAASHFLQEKSAKLDFPSSPPNDRNASFRHFPTAYPCKPASMVTSLPVAQSGRTLDSGSLMLGPTAQTTLSSTQSLPWETDTELSPIMNDPSPWPTFYLHNPVTFDDSERLQKIQKTSGESSFSHSANQFSFNLEQPSPSNSTIYSTLKDDELRYVVLRAGQLKSPIRITFITSNFSQSTAYEALSYVWGEPIYSESIEVQTHDGTVLEHKVTESLSIALKHLRDLVNDRTLWIDALSINQSDLGERSNQVSKMHHIFHRASNVCIWLGDQADDSNAAMDFIAQILDFSAHSKNIANRVKARTLALSKLLARPWFSRRWVVQEMALARNATVHCGTKSIPWTDFADAVALFGIIRDEVVKHMSPDQSYELGETHALGAASLIDISSNIYRKDHVHGRIQERLLNLESLLTKLPMFDVLDARDAVYATIALAKDTFDNTSIPVDYTMPEVTLFAIVTKFVIEKSGSLDIVCCPWAPGHAYLTLPSWIPTVANYPYVRRSDGQYNRQNADTLVGRPEHKHKPYNATGDVGANRHVTIVSGRAPILECSGIEVGTIAEVGDRCVNGNIPKGWIKMARWHDRSKPIPPRLWRTLVADRGPDGENPPNWYGRACRYVFERSGTEDLDTTKMMSAIQSTDIKSFLQRVQSVTWSRKFFVTEGHSGCPGIGPADCEVGDNICILFGCSVPVILRPCGFTYRLIGECYVQGMMGGEAVRAFRERRSISKNYQIL